MASHINKYGLLNASVNDIVSENCVLFSVELLLLGGEKLPIGEYVRKARFSKGRYYQYPLEYDNDEQTTQFSPDQMISYVCWFYINGEIDRIKEIRWFLLTRLFTYDNVSGRINFKRLMQPKAILTVLYCSGWKWVKSLLIFTCNLSIKKGMREGTTSGILKAWTISTALNLKLTDCNYDAAFLTYFKEDGHPIRELIKENL